MSTMLFLAKRLPQFVSGVGLFVFSAHQLVTREDPPSPTALTQAVYGPNDLFVPGMWIGLVAGLVMAGRAVDWAQSMSSGSKALPMRFWLLTVTLAAGVFFLAWRSGLIG
jgi:hypothetical protein